MDGERSSQEDLLPRTPTAQRNAIAIGVDVGGTKVAIGLIGIAEGAILDSVILKTHSDGTRLLGQIADAVRLILRRVGVASTDVAGIGVGVPELVGEGAILTEAVLYGWKRLPILDTFGAIAPTRIESDVRLGALGESWFGAGRGQNSFCYVTVGTGVSFTLVQRGQPYCGVHGCAINLGTTTLADLDSGDSGGRVRLTLEERVAGPALVRRFEKAGGVARRAEEVLAAASAGEAIAVGLVREAGRDLGLGLALVANLLDPGLVIVGGGLGSADTIYWREALAWASTYVHPAIVTTTSIVRAGLGPDSGVVGAGILGYQHGSALATTRTLGAANGNLSLPRKGCYVI